MGKGSIPRPFSVKADEYAVNWERVFGRDDKRAKEGPTDGAKASASSELEANGYGGQGKAQDGRQAEGDE